MGEMSLWFGRLTSWWVTKGAGGMLELVGRYVAVRLSLLFSTLKIGVPVDARATV